jgi:FMN phosphatase YigB (HAD superfamily)
MNMRANFTRPGELLSLLDAQPASVKVLSLDCFDTLLWRNVALPTDVFYSLQQSESHRSLRMSAKLRAQVEQAARQHLKHHTGSQEVTLEGIYGHGRKDLDEKSIAELARQELAAEKRACFAHPMTVDLIRAAKKRGMKVVIVSDTYFSERQLRELLTACVPSDIMSSIDHVFTSSDAKVNKASGLFARVLEKLKVKPAEILHVGDNAHADLYAPKKHGIGAGLLVHHFDAMAEMLRLEESAMSMLDPSIRHAHPLVAPFRGVMAEKTDAGDAAHMLGYAALGPLLYSFGRFVLDELAALSASGKRVKPAFLMRDAYLPKRVCDAMAGKSVGPEVNISRFVGYAASFRSADDVQDYLIRFASTKRFSDLARQLLLPEPMAKDLITAASKKNRPADEFIRRIQRPDVMGTVLEHAKAYRQRFYRSLERTLGLERGDTLVMIDLGYEGTAQRLLAPVLKDEIGVDVVGRYMLVGESPGWHLARKGLIDASWCDERASTSLVQHIALLENLCTKDQGSVVDFEEDGSPVLSENKVSRAQVERVVPVQEAAVTFAKDAMHFFARLGREPAMEDLRLSALASLGRLLYMPTASEIDYIEGFRLDLNMGTQDTFGLFDRQEGLTGLRRRGLFFMEKHQQATRMNYPIELRHAGLELSLAMLAVDRYRLSASYNDFSLRKETLTTVVARGNEQVTTKLDARATHDGFFSLVVPMGEGNLDVGIAFGEKYAWLQIESVHLIPTEALLKDDENERSLDYAEKAHLDGMIDHGGGLMQSSDNHALVMLPGYGVSDEPHVCRIVFRPITAR